MLKGKHLTCQFLSLNGGYLPPNTRECVPGIPEVASLCSWRRRSRMERRAKAVATTKVQRSSKEHPSMQCACQFCSLGLHSRCSIGQKIQRRLEEAGNRLYIDLVIQATESISFAFTHSPQISSRLIVSVDVSCSPFASLPMCIF